MQSKIYAGTVSHTRMEPGLHIFSYKLFMMYLDLEELDSVFDPYFLWSAKKPAIAWFNRKDHWGDVATPLIDSIRLLIKQKHDYEHEGPIRLLTHLRYFGYCMNPVSFYYCFDNSGSSVEFIVAEINNTPWGETHCYVLDAREKDKAVGSVMKFSFDKDFHVSPFMPMDQEYTWLFSPPDENLDVRMNSMRAGKKLFTAYLNLDAKPINAPNLALTLSSFPAMTGKVITAIYWQALRLWLKGTPFYPHPKYLRGEGSIHES